MNMELHRESKSEHRIVQFLNGNRAGNTRFLKIE